MQLQVWAIRLQVWAGPSEGEASAVLGSVVAGPVDTVAVVRDHVPRLRYLAESRFLARSTAHGSTLHAWNEPRGKRARSWRCAVFLCGAAAAAAG